MSVRVINKDFKYQERQSDHDNYCAGFALAAILSDLNGDGTICKGIEPTPVCMVSGFVDTYSAGPATR